MAAALGSLLLAAQLSYNAARLIRHLYNAGRNAARALFDRAGLVLPHRAHHQAHPRANLPSVLSVSVTESQCVGRASTTSRRTTTIRFHHLADQDMEAGGKFARTVDACRLGFIVFVFSNPSQLFSSSRDCEAAKDFRVHPDVEPMTDT